MLRADLILAETRALLAPWRGSCLLAQRGRLFDQLDRIAVPQTPARARPPARTARRLRRPQGRRRAGPRVLQRPRRLRRGRAGICDDPRARPVDAGAVDQRHRQSRFRLPDVEPRAAATPGRSTAARTSSRRGRTIPSATVRARRSICVTMNRRAVEPDRAADPRRRGDLCRPSRPRLQPLRASSPRHRVRPAAVCAARRPDQDLAARAAQRSSRAAPSQRDRLCRMGSRPVARRFAAVRHHRDRCRDRRDVRPQPLERRLRLARRLRRSCAAAQTDWTGDRREFIGRNGTLAKPGGARADAAPLSNTVGAGLDPCARAAAPRRTAAAGASRSFSSSAKPRTRTRRGTSISRYRAADLDAVAVGGRPPLGRRPRRGRRSRRRTGRWTSCSTAGCSTRRSPAASGRAPASIRRAAPTASAISCRTAWRSRAARPAMTREHLLRAAGAAVRRGRRAALVAAAFRPGRAHPHLRRPRLARLSPSPITSTRPATPPSSTRRFRFSRARRSRPASTTASSSRPSPTRPRRCSSIARSRSTRASPLGGHGLPLIGTGDWNDGMNRVGEKARARASGSAGSCTRR